MYYIGYFYLIPLKYRISNLTLIKFAQFQFSKKKKRKREEEEEEAQFLGL